MKVKKIKFEQYRVRGKHREFDILVFPQRRYMWAYHDNDDDVYSIDGDFAAYHLLKYALAVLIADPNKIIYLPIWDNNLWDYYFPDRYDAVLTRTELQLRRSEWVKLRRQLNKAHRIENFVLRYDPDRLLSYAERYRTEDAVWKAYHKDKQELSALCGNTVFITLLKETCFRVFPDFLALEPRQSCGCYHAWHFGYCFSSEWIRYLGERVQEDRLKEQEGKV